MGFSGPVDLLTAAKCGGDITAEGVVQTLIEENPLIEMLPWRTFEGTNLVKRQEGTIPDVNFRKVNADYTATYGADDYTTWGVAILGSQYEIDNYEKLVLANEDDLEALQIRKHVKAMSMRFTWEAINGTHSGGLGFKGLDTLVSDGFGQEHSVGGALSLDDLGEAQDLMYGQYEGSAFLVSQFHVRLITNLALDATNNFPLLDVGDDAFGHRVWHYDGIPLKVLRHSVNPDGDIVHTLINSDTDSDIYLVALSATDAVTGLMGAGGTVAVKRFGELQAAPRQMGRIEWYPAIASFDRYGCIKLDGITDNSGSALPSTP